MTPDRFVLYDVGDIVGEEAYALNGTNTADARKAALAQNVRQAIARGGMVQSQNEFDAVLLYGKPINHMVHLLITIVTCGFWLIGWIIMAVIGGEKRELISVDESGYVTVQRL